MRKQKRSVKYSAAAVIVPVVFDMPDGKIARATKTTSRFGDSCTDFYCGTAVNSSFSPWPCICNFRTSDNPAILQKHETYKS